MNRHYFPRSFFGITATLVTTALLSLSFITQGFAQTPKKTSARVLKEPKEFDRLDGKGASKKRVDVIEWENNLEIHVYPKGSLKALGMKADRTNKDNPVMVIEYAFHGVPYTLIRRAKLTIPMRDGFQAFQETDADGYDKIILSNNTLADGVRPYKLAPPPAQLYPDYHPALGGEEPEERNLATSPGQQSTSPSAGDEWSSQPRRPNENRRPKSAPKNQERDRPASPASNGEGGVRHFSF